MTAAPSDAARTIPTPQIYLACPLTSLTEGQQRALQAEVELIKGTIENVTVGDRAEGDQWPVTIYAPIDQTAPWRNDGLAAGAVYDRNLRAILDSDAVVVLADRAASAGVGQEIEWAARAGIPTLYLSCSDTISRQIAGMPALLTAVAYGTDSNTLSAHVTNFVRTWRPIIEDGPRRRASRRLRYESLTTRLRTAWRAVNDPTGIAARCHLHPNFVESVLADPARIALMATDTLSLLCVELRVRMPAATTQLSIKATRALLTAAEAAGWADDLTEKLRIHGLAAQARDPEYDLDTATAWHTLRSGITPSS